MDEIETLKLFRNQKQINLNLSTTKINELFLEKNYEDKEYINMINKLMDEALASLENHNINEIIKDNSNEILNQSNHSSINTYLIILSIVTVSSVALGAWKFFKQCEEKNLSDIEEKIKELETLKESHTKAIDELNSNFKSNLESAENKAL
jgi:predicted RNase H-related nuclease YkuK (DUF458 family)